MNWVVSSLICSFFVAAYAILLKINMNYFKNFSFLWIVFAIYFFLTGAYYLYKYYYNLVSFEFSYYSIIAAISRVLIVYFISLAMSLVKNPTIAIAYQRIEILFTYFLSLLIFSKKFNFKVIFFIFIMIIGVFLESQASKRLKNYKTNNNNNLNLLIKEEENKVFKNINVLKTVEEEESNIEKKYKSKILFYIFIFLAIIFSSSDDIFTTLGSKKVGIDNHLMIQSFSVLIFTIIIQLLFFKRIDLIEKEEVINNKISFLNKNKFLAVLFLGIISFSMNYFFVKSLENSPNPAFVKCVANIQIIFLYIMSLLVFKKVNLNLKQLFGITIIIVSAIGITII